MRFEKKVRDAEGNTIALGENEGILHLMTTRSHNRGLTWPHLDPATARRLSAALDTWIKRQDRAALRGIREKRARSKAKAKQ